MGLSQHWRTTAGQAGQAGRGLEVRPVRVGQDNVSALVIANFCAFVRQHRDQSGADDCARDDAIWAGPTGCQSRDDGDGGASDGRHDG